MCFVSRCMTFQCLKCTLHADCLVKQFVLLLSIKNLPSLLPMCLTSIDVFCCYSLMEVLSSIGTKADPCSILCKTQLHDCSLIFKLNFKAYPVRVCLFVCFSIHHTLSSA